MDIGIICSTIHIIILNNKLILLFIIVFNNILLAPNGTNCQRGKRLTSTIGTKHVNKDIATDLLLHNFPKLMNTRTNREQTTYIA